MYIVNKEKLSAILGVSARSLDAHINNGMPFVSKPTQTNREWQFDTAVVIAWHIKRKLDKQSQNKKPKTIEEAKARQAAAVAEMSEIKLAREKGTMIYISEVEKNLSKMLTAIRNGMLAIPTRMAMHITGDAKKILEQEIKVLLTKLSSNERI